MGKQDYYNTVGLQIESLFDLAGIQTEKCFDVSKLDGMLDRESFGKLKRIVLTGCGDSYSAVGAMLPALKRLSGLELCDVLDPMNFTKFYQAEDTVLGYAKEETLVVAVSASGSAARIVEILKKANGFGVHSMLISNNPESKGAAAAELMFHVETPELCNTPGLRSYFASMIAVIALGAHIGVCNGNLTEERFYDIQDEILSYVMSLRPLYERIDDQMYELCKTWKDYWKFEVVGDGGESFSAQFVEEKMIECAGNLCTHVDSEDWCHINYFLREPETIGTIFIGNSGSPDFDRLQYSIRSAVGIGRPTLVVSDAAREQFPAGAKVCVIPSAPAGDEWLAPLINFIPGSIVSAYCAALADRLFFGGRYDFRTKTWNVDVNI